MSPELLVVRIEDEFVFRIKKFVARKSRLEDKSFKEPSCVSKVPFDRACIGHRLKHLVLNRDTLGEGQRHGANRAKLILQTFAARVREFSRS